MYFSERDITSYTWFRNLRLRAARDRLEEDVPEILVRHQGLLTELDQKHAQRNRQLDDSEPQITIAISDISDLVFAREGEHTLYILRPKLNCTQGAVDKHRYKREEDGREYIQAVAWHTMSDPLLYWAANPRTRRDPYHYHLSDAGSIYGYLAAAATNQINENALKIDMTTGNIIRYDRPLHWQFLGRRLQPFANLY